jgi:hypothetical protein
MSKETIVKCDLTLDKEQFEKYTDFLVWLKEDREKKKNGENKDVEEKKHINEFSERAAARFLIEEHTIGDLRDKGDLINSQYHAQVSVNFAHDILKNLLGTTEEKITFFENTYIEIPKFYGTQRDNENTKFEK